MAVSAVYRHEVSRDEAAALIAHSVGRHQALRPRMPHRRSGLDVAVAGPGAVFRGVAAASGWFPLLRVVWPLRCVVGVVCVVQSEDVPSSVELRWRPGEHQAALTS